MFDFIAHVWLIALLVLSRKMLKLQKNSHKNKAAVRQIPNDYTG